MPRRQPKYPNKPWYPDKARWRPYLQQMQARPEDGAAQDQPRNGWQLWELKTLKDVSQKERS